MSAWQTTETATTTAPPDAIWARAYADVAAWPAWNPEIVTAVLDGPLALDAGAAIRFRGGLRLRFRVVEFEDGVLFTDEARLPLARMGHRHVLVPLADGGTRLENTIYIRGALGPVWARVMGPRARRALPDSQRRIIALATPPSHP